MTDYVIATSRPWNEVLVQRLTEQTGETFHLITTPEALTLERLQAINPRYVFFPHWSHIVPAGIHERFECVIFHMTNLPYGRGGSPLQNLIQRGHKETVISALRCVAALDAGPIYIKRSLSLEGSAGEIFQRAVGVIESMVNAMVGDQPEPVPQSGEPVYFTRRTPAESDLTAAAPTSLGDFFDFIRMLDAEGYLRAFIDLHSHRIELTRAEMHHDRLEGTFVIYRHTELNNGAERGGVKTLLDRCYPAPPRDVYDRMRSLYHPGDPVYTAEIDGDLIGMTYCATHSKGGHLESLAVDPDYRGLGIADHLVQALFDDTSGVVSLTTRIPAYFVRHGFNTARDLEDGSVFMIRPGPLQKTTEPTVHV